MPSESTCTCRDADYYRTPSRWVGKPRCPSCLKLRVTLRDEIHLWWQGVREDWESTLSEIFKKY